MKDLSTNPLVATNDVAGTYARLDSTYAYSKLFETARIGYQHTNLTTSAGNSLTFNSTGSDATTGRMVVFIAPFALTVTNCGFSYYTGSSGNIAANNTAYWKFLVGKRATSGAETDIAFGTSQSTGTNAIGAVNANTTYWLAGFPWNTTNATFASGDLCQFELSRPASNTGTTPLGCFTITVAYQPL